MKKTIGLLFLVLVLILVFCGCGYKVDNNIYRGEKFTMTIPDGFKPTTETDEMVCFSKIGIDGAITSEDGISFSFLDKDASFSKYGEEYYKNNVSSAFVNADFKKFEKTTVDGLECHFVLFSYQLAGSIRTQYQYNINHNDYIVVINFTDANSRFEECHEKCIDTLEFIIE